MPLVFPGIAQSALIVGRTPGSAADAPVGLLALCMMLTQLFQPRDGGVPRGPGGPPHSLCRIRSFGKNEWHWVGNPPVDVCTRPTSAGNKPARRIPSCPTESQFVMACVPAADGAGTAR